MVSSPGKAIASEYRRLFDSTDETTAAMAPEIREGEKIRCVAAFKDLTHESLIQSLNPSQADSTTIDTLLNDVFISI